METHNYTKKDSIPFTNLAVDWEKLVVDKWETPHPYIKVLESLRQELTEEWLLKWKYKNAIRHYQRELNKIK